eukprot:TRINITY_DN4581_c0_g3_i1.p3 TRINITY_DN4581_c0_g3~~TRINITY_DN4581_c0_g3_i1.p3  ORF type:complete len:109 (+),score=6.49 TRINITY_DN4581_c0_g3_i1:115-441(+)
MKANDLHIVIISEHPSKAVFDLRRFPSLLKCSDAAQSHIECPGSRLVCFVRKRLGWPSFRQVYKHHTEGITGVVSAAADLSPLCSAANQFAEWFRSCSQGGRHTYSPN